MELAPLALAADSISASGRGSQKLSLPLLQHRMKEDPEGYTTELTVIYRQFHSTVELFLEQASRSSTPLGISVDSSVSKDLEDMAMFLAHVTPFYREELVNFPSELLRFLESSARNLPSGLRVRVTQAVILLINKEIISKDESLALFMELQTLGDKALRKLAFSHVIKSIKRMNQKHKNDPRNKALQTTLFEMLKQEDESRAKRALITLCDLHRRRVWSDDRTANAICMACFHASPRIMTAALSFLLDYEKVEYDDDTDDADSEDEPKTPQSHLVISKEAIYKATHAGTTSSKKKKKAKLKRAIRGMKKKQRLSSEKTNTSYYSPLNNLYDAQSFSEKLLSRLQSSSERFDVKMMMLKVIARAIGLHSLILLHFYPYLQKYVQPHQTDVTNLLAAAVQACHDMVPPDAVEPLFKQIVNQFIHDRSRPEVITVGLNAVREICLRMPLLMNEDLLQDLVLYRKSNEKAVSSSARSLLTLFREVCPSLLTKKDRGRPSNPKAKPKAFGEVHVANNVPGLELLKQDCGDNSEEDKVGEGCDDLTDNKNGEDDCAGLCEEHATDGSVGEYDYEAGTPNDSVHEISDDTDNSEEDDVSSDGDSDISVHEKNGKHDVDNNSISREKKRKFSDFAGELNAAQSSLTALKKLARSITEPVDGILSNEDFRRIKELKAEEDARSLLSKQGFKIPSFDRLSTKRVDVAKLEANIKQKFTKEEKLELIRAGREERGKYQARTAIKKKKTGGSSNRQKEHKKAMPLAAKRSKIAKSRQEKKKQQRRSGKQFRGRKAWK